MRHVTLKLVDHVRFRNPYGCLYLVILGAIASCLFKLPAFLSGVPHPVQLTNAYPMSGRLGGSGHRATRLAA